MCPFLMAQNETVLQNVKKSNEMFLRIQIYSISSDPIRNSTAVTTPISTHTYSKIYDMELYPLVEKLANGSFTEVRSNSDIGFFKKLTKTLNLVSLIFEYISCT